MCIADAPVEERVAGWVASWLPHSQRSLEMRIDEVFDRVEVFEARGFEDVRELAGIIAGELRFLDLLDPGRRDDEEKRVSLRGNTRGFARASSVPLPNLRSPCKTLSTSPPKSLAKMLTTTNCGGNRRPYSTRV